jgi:GDSL-like Lipase/Acylhydrolase family
MSVGGDDAYFAKVLQACVVGLGVWTSPCTNWTKTATGVIRDQRPGRVDRLYSAIHSRAPHARVVIVGYPMIFGSCANGSVFAKLHDANDLLDDTVKAAAARHGFAFVDPRGVFAGHSVCDQNAWINGIHVSWNRLWFHPTRAGYQAEAKLIEASL